MLSEGVADTQTTRTISVMSCCFGKHRKTFLLIQLDTLQLSQLLAESSMLSEANRGPGRHADKKEVTCQVALESSDLDAVKSPFGCRVLA